MEGRPRRHGGHIRHVVVYWRQVAHVDIKTAKKLLLTIVLYVVALIVVRWIGGQDDMSDALHWGIASIVAAVVVYLPLAFWYAITLPPKRAREVQAAHDAELKGIKAEHEAQLTKLQNDLQTISAESPDEHLVKAFRQWVREDREHPDRLFPIYREDISWTNANLQVGSYLEFRFRVFSSSIHRVQFNQKPTGRYVRYLKEGKQLGEITKDPELIRVDDNLKGLERGLQGTFTIRQYLTTEMQRLLISHQSQQVGFHFDQIRIPVTTTIINSVGSLDPGPTWVLSLPPFDPELVPPDLSAYRRTE